jgi:phosphatidylinositol 3-kinase
LKRGQQRLLIHRDKEADPSPESTTPSELVNDNDEMGRLEEVRYFLCVADEQLMKDHERGDIVKIDWLDRLAFRQIEQVHQRESANSDRLYLYVDLPRFDFPVVFSEQASHSIGDDTDRQEGHVPQPPIPLLTPSGQAPPTTSGLAPNMLSTDAHLWRTYDPDAWRDNPVEVKHRKLLRSQRLGDEGKDLKPGPADRDRLNVSTSYESRLMTGNIQTSPYRISFGA